MTTVKRLRKKLSFNILNLIQAIWQLCCPLIFWLPWIWIRWLWNKGLLLLIGSELWYKLSKALSTWEIFIDNEILTLEIKEAQLIWSLEKEIWQATLLPKKDTLLQIEVTRTKICFFIHFWQWKGNQLRKSENTPNRTTRHTTDALDRKDVVVTASLGRINYDARDNSGLTNTFKRCSSP